MVTTGTFLSICCIIVVYEELSEKYRLYDHKTYEVNYWLITMSFLISDRETIQVYHSTNNPITIDLHVFYGNHIEMLCFKFQSLIGVIVSCIDSLHVKYLGGDLVPKAALDYCSSWYRYVQQKD